MADEMSTENAADRLAEMEERLVRATGQAFLATAFAAAILRELIKSGTLKHDAMSKFTENAFNTIKDHRHKIDERDRPGYDIAVADLSTTFGLSGRRT